ncbi:MAG: ring-cleaving dioxygenase [Chthoniobacterales bacterium]
MNTVRGLHHITAISGPAQENVDFYAGVLGMRLVKKSVNQDDPGTYHLFYADAEGHPGTDITFFPWAQMAPSRDGYGLGTEVSLAVPPGSLVFWSGRLQRYGIAVGAPETRFGEDVLTVRDPHGLRVALVESESSLGRHFTPWEDGPIPVQHQIRGLETARMEEEDFVVTSGFLTRAMGFREIGMENGWHRYAVGEGRSGQYVDVRELSGARRGAWGTGSIHHIAWRVDDDAHETEMRGKVAAGGAQPTPVIDRFWFKSVYFKEPGGVLFELATDGPGFAVDEDAARLGETLVLPPWLEQDRAAIEASLPKVTMPAKE